MQNTTVKLTNNNLLEGKYKQAVIDMTHKLQESVEIDGGKYTLHSYSRKDDDVVIVVELSHE